MDFISRSGRHSGAGSVAGLVDDARQALVQCPWHDQAKFSNRCLKAGAVFSDTKVTAVHGAGRCTNLAAAGVLKALAGFEQWLVAYYAKTFDFTNFIVAVGDQPMAADQLRADAADVGDGDRVGEGKFTLLGHRLVGQVAAFDADFDGIFRIGHVLAGFRRTALR